MNYFLKEEFECAGVPVFEKMDKDFFDKLELARLLADVPFRITSSYRTTEHNKKVGGKPNSAHTKGKAVDISVSSGTEKFKIVNAAMGAGFTRIGIAKTFIHIDSDETKPQNVIWTY